MPLSHETKKNKPAFGWRDDAAAGLDIACILVAGWGVFILFFQVMGWAQHGQWTAVPVLSLFVEIPVADTSRAALYLVPADALHSDWLAAPTEWLGLHRLIYGALDLLPLSVCLYGAAIVIYAYRVSLSEGPLVLQQ